jgi:HlyD family secretion protein
VSAAPIKRIIGGGAALVALAALIAALLWRDNDHAGLITLYGNVDIREVELAFRVPGRLGQMPFEEGDAVSLGAVVAQLDDMPYRQSLAAADARVQAAQAAYDKFTRGLRPQELAQARAQVREVQASAANAEREYQRQLDLRESGAASQGTLDAALARRDETAARLTTARESLALAEEGFRTEDIAAAHAELAGAQAQRDQAQTQLDDTALLAPTTGTILARIREPGSIVAAGTPVYVLSLDAPVYIRAYVGEPDLGRVAPGSAATITTDSSTRSYKGRIGFVSPRAEFTPRSVETTELRTDLVYRLRIVVTDPDAALRQGMPVSVTIESTKPGA